MCNLYSNTTNPEAMRRLFAVAAEEDRLGNLAPAPAIHPRATGAVLRLTREGGRRLETMHWGFVLPQVSKRTGKPILPKAVNNARDDRLRASPFWKASFERRRCLVPATSFCETKGRGPATFVWFGMAGEAARPVFAFAGLWTRYRGLYKEEEVELDCYTVVTTRPNPLVAEVHPDRMPAILPPEDWDTWLAGAPDEAASLIGPFPAEAMRVVREGVGETADPAPEA